jgi:coproporphyrinogen III oxidase-like Fe-S oxidoreductase
MEIEEPINITIENREKTEEKQKKTDKRVPSNKQLEQLKKAREAKKIKKKAIEMYDLTNVATTPEIESSYNINDYTQYIMPLMAVIGSIGGFYLLKKKISTQPLTNSNNTSQYTQDKQEIYSKLQLNF